VWETSSRPTKKLENTLINTPYIASAEKSSEELFGTSTTKPSCTATASDLAASSLIVRWQVTVSGTQLASLTGQLTDKLTRGQSSRGLDNSRTGQLADSKFLKIMALLYFICTLNLTLTTTLTPSNTGSI